MMPNSRNVLPSRLIRQVPHPRRGIFNNYLQKRVVLYARGQDRQAKANEARHIGQKVAESEHFHQRKTLKDIART